MNLILALLNSLWMSVAAVVIAGVAMRFLSRMNAATRFAIWWAVLGVMVAAPAALLIRSAEPAPVPTAPVAISVPDVAPLPQPSVTAPELPAARETLRPVALRNGSWPLWIFGLWSAVFLFHLLRIAWSYQYLRGVKRRATRPTPEQRLNFDEWAMTCHVGRPVRLLLSSEIASPMAVGFGDPAVILPAALPGQLTQQALDHALLHELAHIARRDDWTNLLAHIARGALFLHPVAAWVLRRIEHDREIACDDWVVAVTGSAQPYAASLARMVELRLAQRRQLLATGMLGGKSQLRERIERLVHRAGQIAPEASRIRVALCAAILIVLCTIGAQAPPWVTRAQDLPQEPPPAPAPAPVVAPKLGPAPNSSAAPAVAPVQGAPETKSEGKVSFLAALGANGYKDLSVDQIIEMRGVGITGEYITAMNGAGLGKLTAKELVDLRIHGVSPAFVREVHALGFGPFTARQVTELAMFGARIELFRALKDAGFVHADAADIQEAFMSGLTAAQLREAKNYGSKLTLKQIVRMRQAGVL